MSIEYKEEQFKDHIKAVVSQGQIDHEIGDRPLTLAELKELAISMGVTEEGWKNLLKKAETHLKSADDHLKALNFSEAISQGEQATAINPYISNGNSVLARAYMMLWLEEKRDELREKAEFHARQELKVDPKDMEAIKVLSTINKKEKILREDNNSRKRILIIAGVIAVVLVLSIAFWPKSSANAGTTDTASSSDRSIVKDQLIEAEEEVNSTWDLVQNQIDRRNNLVPDLFRAVEGSHEDMEVLESTIEDLKTKIAQSEGEERFELENDLETKIEEAKDLATEYANSEAIETLLIQIEGSENRISFEKKKYNEAIKNYNILVKKNQDDFPEYAVKPYFSK